MWRGGPAFDGGIKKALGSPNASQQSIWRGGPDFDGGIKKALGSPNASQQSIWRGGPDFDGRIRQHSVHQMLASKAFGGGVPILMVV